MQVAFAMGPAGPAVVVGYATETFLGARIQAVDATTLAVLTDWSAVSHANDSRSEFKKYSFGALVINLLRVTATIPCPQTSPPSHFPALSLQPLNPSLQNNLVLRASGKYIASALWGDENGDAPTVVLLGLGSNAPIFNATR